MKYFPLREAIWLPVFVSHRVLLKLCAGEVRILAPIHTRMIQIGFGDVGIFDAKYSRSIWEVNGFVEFQGVARLGHGTKISVGENASLVLGKEVGITAETAIVCMKKISLGAGTLISWENLIMDTDFHCVVKHGEILNHPKEIKIGDRVWIGCRCTILKGSHIQSNTVVAAGSLITQAFMRENVIIGGVPAKILRYDIDWHP